MAETVKKAKARVKAKAASGTKKKAASDKVAAVTPSRAEIAQLAERYWAERGWHEGQAEQDWLRAERELMKMAS